MPWAGGGEAQEVFAPPSQKWNKQLRKRPHLASTFVNNQKVVHTPLYTTVSIANFHYYMTFKHYSYNNML